jgi:hypothetical protein
MKRFIELKSRVGRRGGVLAFLAAMDLATSMYIREDYISEQVREVMNITLPLPGWSWVWTVVGIVTIVQAFLKYDALGYMINTAMFLSLALAYMLASFMGMDRGWSLSIVWFGVSGIIYIAAGWPESDLDS